MVNQIKTLESCELLCPTVPVTIFPDNLAIFGGELPRNSINEHDICMPMEHKLRRISVGRTVVLVMLSDFLCR
jgi:hypothetical protein